MILRIPNSVAAWLACGERGVSSETIVAHLVGVPGLPRGGRSHPHDPDDLRRCDLLLAACPELHRPFVEQMPFCSPAWSRLVAIWDDLIEVMHREADANAGHCPETYALMRLAIGDDGWCATCGAQVFLGTCQDGAWCREYGKPLVVASHKPGGGAARWGTEWCPGTGKPADVARAS